MLRLFLAMVELITLSLFRAIFELVMHHHSPAAPHLNTLRRFRVIPHLMSFHLFPAVGGWIALLLEEVRKAVPEYLLPPSFVPAGWYHNVESHRDDTYSILSYEWLRRSRSNADLISTSSSSCKMFCDWGLPHSRLQAWQ